MRSDQNEDEMPEVETKPSLEMGKEVANMSENVTIPECLE